MAEYTPDEVWRIYMITGKVPVEMPSSWFEAKVLRPIVHRLPEEPRCRICSYPFHGIGGRLARSLLDLKPSRLNPQLCNVCERFAQRFRGGAEVEASFLFADVRGSTRLAEQMSPLAFSELINRFYHATSHELYAHNAMIEKLIGDEVTGFFVPGFAGADHTRVAIETAKAILLATGHTNPDGPWIPVGVGVHVGNAYIGSVVSAEGLVDIAALGDPVNVAARLASLAQAGEVVLSEEARQAARISPEGMQSRRLELKGRSEPVDVWALSVSKQVVP
jgi:adenylate cyclase